jgi:hypothetical protein
MMKNPILAGYPFSSEKTKEIVEQFHRNGYVHIPNVITPNEVTVLRNKTDQILDDPELQKVPYPNLDRHFNPNLEDKNKYIELREYKSTGKKIPYMIRNTIELDQTFRDMLVRELILSIPEAISGKDVKFCRQNIMRSIPDLSSQHSHQSFHCDQSGYPEKHTVQFPLPDEIKRHDSRIRMPVFWITVQIALTDIESVNHGPTQYVPASHYAGRIPDSNDENPEFDGKGPVSILCKAGDIYFQDPMCWHRGAPNKSDRTRYIFQSQYATRWAYARFNLFNRVPVKDDDLKNASDRLLDVLGRVRSKDI